MKYNLILNFKKNIMINFKKYVWFDEKGYFYKYPKFKSYMGIN